MSEYIEASANTVRGAGSRERRAVVPRGKGNREKGIVRWCALLVVLPAVLLLTACGNAGADKVTSIDATGFVAGLAYFDGNGTREPEVGEDPLEGVGVALVLAGTADTVRTTTSDQDGVFTFSDVLVGSYRIVVDTNTIGDSTIVAGVDPSDVSVTPDDSLAVSVAISFPFVTAVEARSLAAGTRVFIDAIALNSVATFGDASIHVSDTSGALRSIRSGAGPVFAADSVRLRGRISTDRGEPVIDLDRQTPAVLTVAEVPPPDTITTAVASSAEAGVLDAALVHVDSSRITDTTTVNGDLVATVSDGSGDLEVVFDADVGFNLGPNMRPGGDLKVTGLLVPTGSGGWQLKPRSDADVDVIAPVIPIANARTKPVGEIVFIDGIALNDRSTYGDNTVNLSDTSAAIRMTGVVPAVGVRDSIRVIGTIAQQDGQPVIENATISLLGSSFEPQPQDIPSGGVPGASGGTLDADLVKITGASITATSTVAGDFHVTVDDGSGAATVVIDQDLTGFATFDFSSWVPGASLTATGLLVPTGGGVWVLKPRSIIGANPDVTVQ